MQIVGGRWEVCLGDGSCVLFLLSFPSACFRLYIMVQILSLSVASPFPGLVLPAGVHAGKTDLRASSPHT